MESLFAEFGAAHKERDGYKLSKTLSPDISNDRLKAVFKSCNANDVRRFLKTGLERSCSDWERLEAEEVKTWVEIYFNYWRVAGELLAIQGSSAANGKAYQSSWGKIYDMWAELLQALTRGYNEYGLEAWTIPCLYVVSNHLRIFAIKADEERNQNTALGNSTELESFDDFDDPESQENQTLRDCCHRVNRVFNICLADRYVCTPSCFDSHPAIDYDCSAPLEESRKWGIYYIANLIFKIYFKLDSASLIKNIIKAISAGRGDMPELSRFPKSQQVTFNYFQGVLYFLEEDYVAAEKHLTEALNLCHKDAMRNKELILTYLIPCHLLTTHTLPSQKLLEPYPKLQKMFTPLSQCIKRGELHAFDLALQDGEEEFVKRRIYLTLERGRDIALRNLCRKVFLAGGFEESKDGAPPVRRSRIPVAEFAAAISLGSQEKIDNDEVECLLANMIYKNLMKGYISRAASIVVLSKTGAFPGTGV
ncbi:COP9 signalosome complex subunit 12 [Rhypophila sp. PSN 637]